MVLSIETPLAGTNTNANTRTTMTTRRRRRRLLCARTALIDLRPCRTHVAKAQTATATTTTRGFQVSSFLTHSGDFCVGAAQLFFFFSWFTLPSHLRRVCVAFGRGCCRRCGRSRTDGGRPRYVLFNVHAGVSVCGFVFFCCPNVRAFASARGSLIEFDIVILWDARTGHKRWKVCACLC